MSESSSAVGGGEGGAVAVGSTTIVEAGGGRASGVAVGSGSFDSSRVLAEAATALQLAKREGRDQIVFR